MESVGFAERAGGGSRSSTVAWTINGGQSRGSGANRRLDYPTIFLSP